MKASMTHPVYTANLIKSNGTKYRLKGITTDLVVGQGKDELAEKVTMTLINIKVGNTYLHKLINLKDKIYVYANTGTGSKLVFKGFIWERNFSTSSDTKEITITCYDRLIYFHNCKDNIFMKKGKTSKDVITYIAKKWGFKISYKYLNITHGKLVYHNQSIADIIISILDKVKKKTGKDYVIRLENNVILIETVGSNKTVYKVESKKNAISANYKQTMDGMVTKVLIVKAETVKKKNSTEETGKYLTVTSLQKNKDKYGTLQDIIVKNSDDKLSEVKKEAQEILNEHGNPQVDSDVTAIDNPWIKKGFKIYVSAGIMNNYYIVQSIEHNAQNNTMYLEVKRA